MVRSFTYSALTEQTLEWLQKITEAKNKNQLFEPLVENMLRASLAGLPEGSEDLGPGRELMEAWDQVRRAEGLRSAGVQRPAGGLQ